MKRQLRYILGTIIFAIVAFALSAANAQTTSNGPYYANPSWDQKLQCDTQATCPRFIVLSNWSSAAVLDRETGLVWEQSPDTNIHDWVGATFLCANNNVGGRKGWRLPSINELASLIDPSAVNPFLPAGHPFTNVQSSLYWSATTVANVASSAWRVSLNGGSVGANDKASLLHAWCVRGGGALDNY